MASPLIRRVYQSAKGLRQFVTSTSSINDELSIAHFKRDNEKAEKIVSVFADKRYAQNTSIYWACRFQTADVVRELMQEKEADIFFTNEHEDNQSLLHMACWNGDVDMVEYLMKFERSQIINLKDKNHITPLHVAVSNGKTEAVDFLIRNGADLTIRNTSGRSPHQSAARYGHTQILAKLLEHGSDMHAIDYNGDALVHLAASSGRKEVLRYLEHKGADMHQLNKKSLRMPIHKAAIIHPFTYRTAALEFLISRGADLTVIDKDGNRPIDLAENLEQYIVLREAMIEKKLSVFKTVKQDSANPSVFVSYRRTGEQKQFVKKFVEQLTQQKFNVWLDDNDMFPGDMITTEISDGIKKSDLFVCLLSKEFFESEWCPKELHFANFKRKKVFPIWWNNDELPDTFEFKHGDKMLYSYNSQADNPEEELKKCVSTFTKRFKD